MGKKTESKVSLSLKDLERLGVIRKKLKRRRKKDKLKKAIVDAAMGGIKSDSSHLQKGYSNTFSNTSNLTTESQRLQNNLLTDANERHKKELLNKDMENEKYKNQIHSALHNL